MTRAKIKISPQLKAELEKFAAQTRRDQTELANEALEQYLEREKRNFAHICEGLAQTEQGDFVTAMRPVAPARQRSSSA